MVGEGLGILVGEGVGREVGEGVGEDVGKVVTVIVNSLNPHMAASETKNVPPHFNTIWSVGEKK